MKHYEVKILGNDTYEKWLRFGAANIYQVVEMANREMASLQKLTIEQLRIATIEETI